MNSISDSSAIVDHERIFSQHQAALTLVQDMLSDPTRDSFRWLDLGCGKGQILVHLDQVLPPKMRNKIIYKAVDINNDHLRHAKENASRASVQFEEHVGTIGDFCDTNSPPGEYDFITATNIIHELLPLEFAKLLVFSVHNLSAIGKLFVYDMETLPVSELGAVEWKVAEVENISKTLCDGFGAQGYEGAVSQWKHKSVRAWNLLVSRSHINEENENAGDIEAGYVNTVLESVQEEVERLIAQKLDVVKNALKQLTEFGNETSGEALSQEDYLRQFWALSRV